MSLFGSEKREIFHKVALERLASPDQLDQLGSVTNLRGWISLVGLIVVIAAALLWSILGSIPTRVKGRGVLLTYGGVVNVVSQSFGTVAKLHVRPEQTVRQGETLAAIAQPELIKEIEGARGKLSELEAQHEQALAYGSKDMNLHREILSKQRENLVSTIQVLRERRRWHKERLASLEQVYARGLVTKQTMLDTQQNLQNVEAELKDTENKLQQLSAQELEHESKLEQESVVRRLQMSEARRLLDTLEKRLELNAIITSPCNGRVLEIMAGEGDLVRTATPLISIEPQDRRQEGLEAVIYISMADGKTVQPEMTAQITPASVKREEYGFIHATVKSVSRFPSTAEGMKSILGNEQLVKSLLNEGAPVAVRAELETSSETPSGYRWSSGKGPPIEVTSGTFCDVYITVREQPPISMIVPHLRKTLGLL